MGITFGDHLIDIGYHDITPEQERAMETDEKNTLADVLTMLSAHGCKVEPCGSRVTCSPPPNDTDQDFLVEMVHVDKDAVGRLVNGLSGLNFHWEGNEHYQDAAGDFMSWRRDDVNLIVTANVGFAARHRVATGICRRLNLLDKQDRIAVFQAILYGNEWNGETWAEMKAKRAAKIEIQPAEFPF